MPLLGLHRVYLSKILQIYLYAYMYTFTVNFLGGNYIKHANFSISLMWFFIIYNKTLIK